MSKVQFQFDKKQMPQVIVLGLLSAGMLGYFSTQMLTPPPPERASAATRTTAAGTQDLAESQGVDELAELTNGLPPSDSMHDPFIPLLTQQKPPITTPVQQPAPTPFNMSVNSLKPLAPSTFTSEIKPITPLAPMTPVQAPPMPWSCTGVLAGPGSHDDVAVLRDGDSRRFVALGDMVDSVYRLIGVDRYGVTISDGTTRFRLLLGAVETPSAPTALPAVSGEQAAGPLIIPTASTN